MSCRQQQAIACLAFSCDWCTQRILRMCGALDKAAAAASRSKASSASTAHNSDANTTNSSNSNSSNSGSAANLSKQQQVSFGIRLTTTNHITLQCPSESTHNAVALCSTIHLIAECEPVAICLEWTRTSGGFLAQKSPAKCGLLSFCPKDNTCSVEETLHSIDCAHITCFIAKRTTPRV